MTLLKRGTALVCLAGLFLAACSSSKHSGSPGGTASPTTAASTGATIPPPAKITGSLSGPGVTANTITIGQIATITGPVPGLFQGADNGLDAWAAWVNANGGLDGRQVKIDHVDDAFSCTTYTNAMRQFSTTAFAVVGNLTLEDSCGKTVLASDPNLLDIQALALDPTLYSVPNVYTASPNPPGGVTTGLQYIKNKFPQDITHAAALVGVSAKANGKEEQLTAESIGYKYLYIRNISDFETNYLSDILRMKNDGVKFVDLSAVAVGNIAGFLQQAAQQNFHPDVVYGATAYDATFFKLLGNKSLANGIVYSSLPDAMYLGEDRATVPAVNTFLTWLQNTHPGSSANLFAVDAWGAGQLLVKAMQEAGSDITQTSVAQAIKAVTSFNADGLIGQSDPGQKLGTHCIIMAGVVNGQWQRLEPASGFDCSGVYHQVPLSEVQS